MSSRSAMFMFPIAVLMGMVAAGGARGEVSAGEAEFRRGLEYMRDEKFALAVEHLLEAEQSGAEGAELHLALARAYEKLGLGLGRVRRVAVEEGRPGEFYRGELLLEPVGRRSGEFLAAPRESAIYHLRRAMAEGAEGIEPVLAEARIWLDARRCERAVELFEAVEARLPEADIDDRRKAEVYESYARALLGADDVEGFVARFRQAVALDEDRFKPQLGAMYEKAADRYCQRGDLRRCIEHLELAASESPGSAELHYRLGNSYWESGEKQPAARHWQITLQMSPDHPDRARMWNLIASVNAGAGD